MRTHYWHLGIAAAVIGCILLAVLITPAARNRTDVPARRKALLKRLGEGKDQQPNVPPSDGLFLKIMAESTGAQRALEIGSSNGYASIWIGSGLERTGGHLWTIEIDAARARACRQNLAEAGLDGVVTSIEGDAFDAVPRLEDKGPWDFVFINAAKIDYHRYLEMVRPNLADGAVILAHNAILFKDDMKPYLDIVRNDPAMDTVIVSTTMDDGFAVTYFRKPQKAPKD